MGLLGMLPITRALGRGRCLLLVCYYRLALGTVDISFWSAAIIQLDAATMRDSLNQHPSEHLPTLIVYDQNLAQISRLPMFLAKSSP